MFFSKVLMVLLVAVSSVALSGEPTNQPTNENCEEFITQFPGVHVYRQRFNAKTCFLSVGPAEVSGLVYRSFLFSNNGAFMVFNSYGKGPGIQHGARLFYFFPRLQMPNIASGNNNIVSIVTSSPSITLDFDAKTAKLTFISGGNIVEAEDIHPDNQGGVGIDQVNGLMLDVGYAHLKDPSTNLEASSLFKDHLGNTCQVKNNEVFKTVGDDVEFKFSDDDLKSFLQSNCPTLKLLF